ncbi:MAG: transposase [Clostridia bacterium]
MQHNELLHELLNNFNYLLHSDGFLEDYRVANHFVRRSALLMEKMVKFLLYSPKTSLSNKLEQLRENLPDLDFPSVSKQALSKARYGIRYELFQEFFEHSANFYYEHVMERKLWNDRYHIFAIDGSTHEVPSSKSTFKEFGKQSDQKNPDLYWSMALALVLYDVLEDVIVDAAIEKQFYSEREMSLRHLARLFVLGLENDSIVIFDRGYYSAEIYQEWVTAGCKVLMRLKKPNRLCSLDGDDVLDHVNAPDGTKIDCRVIKYTLSSGEIEYLITAVRQDFYIVMLQANLASLIKHQADEIISSSAKSESKYIYAANRIFIIGKVCRNLLRWITIQISQSQLDEIVLEASKKRSQVRPGRSCKRKRRTRARKHYNNRKAAV